MYVVFTRQSAFGVSHITENTVHNYDLRENTLEERKAAKAVGYRFAHLFRECVGDYGETYYDYVASEILS